MRLAGRITDWNDDRGFGFVVPNGGGTRAFVHINQFQRGSRRPVDGDIISYLPTVDSRGRTNAVEARHAGQRVNTPRDAGQRVNTPRATSRFPRAMIGLLALAGGVGAFFAGWLPAWLVGVYLVTSALSYVMYWWDKRTAERNAQRTPESNLHLVDLLGGWPGALVAQQEFRHKTAKLSFQITFWATVVLNLAAAVWLVRSGMAADLVARFFG